ncbi:MAG: aminopeptidase N [Alphaproteobacteria bacterium]
MDARSETQPQAIKLSDYRPPNWLVDDVALTFDLEAEATIVHAVLSLHRNPAGIADAPIELFGEDIELLHLAQDAMDVEPSAYTIHNGVLTLPMAPEAATATLEIITRTNPKANTRLEGLYMSGGKYCTQCEAEGFRRITWYPDRPDVLATFTVTMRADKNAFPVLLSNGNKISARDLDDGRHEAVWHDPHPKPCYLFALVAGDLECLADDFITSSGREVALNIWVEHGNAPRAAYAMDALKRSMKWDEEVFGLEYDLDLFNIVAVSDFNMGAMENKSLNVFNAKYVLADPETATDQDYAFIESIVAHEYFHNWTGNRVTCRDWFQLSLKEGLTVFRDQQFSADERSAAVQRIEDVKTLRARQFPEDGGPLAHPVRPAEFIEINNFYTATVYEKGAEVIRMMHRLLGADNFRKGMDLYFQRHDGQAVTCDDFAAAMSDASGIDLADFKGWYAQAGTPEISMASHYDAATKQFVVEVAQQTKPTPGQAQKQPMVIPLGLGLIGPQGNDLAVTPNPAGAVLRQECQSFVFEGVEVEPVLSANRGFAAPVHVKYEQGDAARIHQIAHDSDPFARWEAGQSYATEILVADLAGRGQESSRTGFIAAMGNVLADQNIDNAFKAQMLTLPGESTLAEAVEVIDVTAIHNVREALARELAQAHEAALSALYHGLSENVPFSPDAASAGRRALKNTALGLLSRLDDHAALAVAQYGSATNMTDRMAALGVLNNRGGDDRAAALKDFYQRFEADTNVIDKWFALQAMSHLPDTLDQVKGLLDHPAFSINNPNKVRSVIGVYAMSNPLRFHDAAGEGAAFLAEQLLVLDKINPQIAARLLSPLGRWRRFDAAQADHMKAALDKILARTDLSKDLFEVAQKARAE